MLNKFEMSMFDGESICFEFNSIVLCNKNIKEQLLKGCVEITAPTPYIIITNNKFNDDEIEVLEDASIGDALSYVKAAPAFGGVIV